MSKLITQEDVVAEFEKLDLDTVNPFTYGKYGEATCVYTDQNDKHCFVGTVLVNLGVTVPALGDENNTQPFGVIVSLLEVQSDVQFTPQARTLLQHAQFRADEMFDGRPATTWGEAIDYAMKYHRDEEEM